MQGTVFAGFCFKEPKRGSSEEPSSGKSIPGRGESRCKGTGVGKHTICPRREDGMQGPGGVPLMGGMEAGFD